MVDGSRWVQPGGGAIVTTNGLHSCPFDFKAVTNAVRQVSATLFPRTEPSASLISDLRLVPIAVTTLEPSSGNAGCHPNSDRPPRCEGDLRLPRPFRSRHHTYFTVTYGLDDDFGASQALRTD